MSGPGTTLSDLPYDLSLGANALVSQRWCDSPGGRARPGGRRRRRGAPATARRAGPGFKSGRVVGFCRPAGQYESLNLGMRFLTCCAGGGATIRRSFRRRLGFHRGLHRTPPAEPAEVIRRLPPDPEGARPLQTRRPSVETTGRRTSRRDETSCRARPTHGRHCTPSHWPRSPCAPREPALPGISEAAGPRRRAIPRPVARRPCKMGGSPRRLRPSTRRSLRQRPARRRQCPFRGSSRRPLRVRSWRSLRGASRCSLRRASRRQRRGSPRRPLQRRPCRPAPCSTATASPATTSALKTAGLMLDTARPGQGRRCRRSAGRRWRASCAPARCRRPARPRPDAATYAAVDHVARDRARPRRRGQAQSRPGAGPPPEPDRIRQRDPRSAAARDRRAARCCRPTMPTSRASTTSPTCCRCRRRCSSATCRRPAQDQPPGDRRRRRSCRSSRPTRPRRCSGRTSGWTRTCRSARAAAWRCATLSRSTANTSCQGPPEAPALRLHPRPRPSRTSSRCGSTARGSSASRSAATPTASPRPPTFVGNMLGEPEWERLHARGGRRPRGPRARRRRHPRRRRRRSCDTPAAWRRRAAAAADRLRPRHQRALRRQSGDRQHRRSAGPTTAARPRRHAEPPAHLRLPAVQRRRRSGAARRQILSTLARRAYRRPVTDDRPRRRCSTSTSAGAQAGGFERGIQDALERLLADPDFLFRIERDPAGIAPGAPYRLSDLELASRLSFFLWSSIPDDELLEAAEQGRLKDPAVLEQQVRADAGRSAVRGAGRQLRRPVAGAAQHPRA